MTASPIDAPSDVPVEVRLGPTRPSAPLVAVRPTTANRRPGLRQRLRDLTRAEQPPPATRTLSFTTTDPSGFDPAVEERMRVEAYRLGLRLGVGWAQTRTATGETLTALTASVTGPRDRIETFERATRP